MKVLFSGSVAYNCSLRACALSNLDSRVVAITINVFNFIVPYLISCLPEHFVHLNVFQQVLVCPKSRHLVHWMIILLIYGGLSYMFVFRAFKLYTSLLLYRIRYASKIKQKTTLHICKILHYVHTYYNFETIIIHKIDISN